MPEKAQITGLILAGGRGTRMGTIDKGLQLLGDQPLVSHVIQRILPQVGNLIINANQNLDSYKQFGFPVISDEIKGFAGPLAGLQTGLKHAETSYLVTVPCDGPFLPEDLVSKLFAEMQRLEADVAVATTNDGEHERDQPVYCLLKTSLLPQVEKYLESDNRKMAGWYAPLKVAKVHFDDEAAFRNINTQNELKRYSLQ